MPVYANAFPDGTAYPTIGAGSNVVNVASSSALTSALSNAIAGQRIVLASGTYSGSFTLSDKAAPAGNGISIESAAVGGAVFSSGSKFTITNCSHVTVSGLSFPFDAEGDTFQFRGTSNNCRLTRTLFGPSSLTPSDLVSTVIYVGDDCHRIRIDHNEIRNKGTSGNGIRVYGNFDTFVGCKYVRIDHNYIHDIGPEVGNDKEAIRYGVSTMSRTMAWGVIERNILERVEAEPEVISGKMGGLRISGNRLSQCAGGLVARHGTDYLVTDNYIIDRQSTVASAGLESGGIRFYDARHDITHNYVDGIIGENFQDALLLDTGDAEGTSTNLAAHWRVVNATVERNVIVNTPTGITIGDNYSSAPTGCVIRDNVVAQTTTGLAITQRITPVSTTISANIYGATPAAAGLAQDANTIWRRTGYGPRIAYPLPAIVGPTGDTGDTDGTGPDITAGGSGGVDPGSLSAASRYGWGVPLSQSDEFDYTGPPNSAKWSVYNGPGHSGNGTRDPARVTVTGGKLVGTGLANGASFGMEHKLDQQYGRWEVRMRSFQNATSNGNDYHPVLIIWPQTEGWPEGGEYDFSENSVPGDNKAAAFIHFPHDASASIQQRYFEKPGVDWTQFHNIGIEWTSQHIKGFIDGEEWFSTSGGANSVRRDIQTMLMGALTIQLDNFDGTNQTPATMEVEWARVYTLNAVTPGGGTVTAFAQPATWGTSSYAPFVNVTGAPSPPGTLFPSSGSYLGEETFLGTTETPVVEVHYPGEQVFPSTGSYPSIGQEQPDQSSTSTFPGSATYPGAATLPSPGVRTVVTTDTQIHSESALRTAPGSSSVSDALALLGESAVVTSGTTSRTGTDVQVLSEQAQLFNDVRIGADTQTLDDSRISRIFNVTDAHTHTEVLPSSFTQEAGGGAVVDLEFRLVAVAGVVQSPPIILPDYISATVSPIRNSPGSFQFEYPAWGMNYQHLRSLVDNDLDAEIEIWFDGSARSAMRGYILESDGDDVEEIGTRTFSGCFLEYRMTEVVLPNNSANAERGDWFFTGKPGSLVGTIMNLAQSRGFLTDITYATFGSDTDSNGVNWAFQGSMTVSPGSNYLEILNNLYDIGFLEWEITRNHELKIYNYGSRGRDRTVQNPPLELKAGKHVREAPRKHSVRNAATDLVAAGKEGVYTSVFDASARARRGRRIEQYASNGNIETLGALTQFSQNKLRTITSGITEVTHGLTFGPGDPVPILDYDIGDWVYSDTRENAPREKLRVVQWTVSQDEDGAITGSIVLNDFIEERTVELNKRLNALQKGFTIVGTSTVNPGQDTGVPAAPSALGATSDAYQLNGETFCTVSVEWAPVTRNTDGTVATDIAGYVVRLRYNNTSSIPPTTAKLQAAQLILDRVKAGQEVDPQTLLWEGAPALVVTYAPQLEDEWRDAAAINPERYGPLINFLNWYVSSQGGIQGAFLESPLTTNTFYTFDEIVPNQPVSVAVRAQDNSGNTSLWSPEFTLITTDDATPPPKPSMPEAVNHLGVIDVFWDGLGSFGEVMPLDFAYLETHVATSATYTPSPVTLFDTTIRGKGGTVYSPPALGVTYFFRFVAVDASGNKSIPSEVASATPEQVVDLGNILVEAANIAEGAVTTPAIAPEAVITQHLSIAHFADNTLRNGGFEDADLDNPSMAAGWSLYKTGGTTVSAQRVVGESRSGSASLQVSLTNASGFADIAAASIPVQPGERWYVDTMFRGSKATIGGVQVIASYSTSQTGDDGGFFLGSPQNIATTWATQAATVQLVVPTSVGGLTPKWLRVVVRIGSVSGDTTPMTVWLDDVRARKVVGRAIIADAAIGSGQIEDAAIQNAKIANLDVGKLTSGTATFTMLMVGGSIRSADTGQRWVLDSAGFNLYNSAGTNTVSLSNTGNALITGQFQTANTGTRIVMNPGSAAPDTIRFYPTLTNVYSSIDAISFGSGSIAGIRIVGSGTDAVANRGMLIVRDQYVSMLHGRTDLSYWGSEIWVEQAFTRMKSATVDLIIDQRLTPVSGTRRVSFINADTLGAPIPSGHIQYMHASDDRPWLWGVNQNCGLKFDANELAVTAGNSQVFANIKAAGFPTGSSEQIKDDIGSGVVIASGRSTWDVIEGAPSKDFLYWWEKKRRPAKPTNPDGSPLKWRVANPDLSAAEIAALPDSDPKKFAEKDAEWIVPELPQKMHRFPMAEDLAALDPSLIIPGERPEDASVDLRDMVGVLWDAVDKLIKRTREIESALPKKLSPRPQRGDVINGVRKPQEDRE